MQKAKFYRDVKSGEFFSHELNLYFKLFNQNAVRVGTGMIVDHILDIEPVVPLNITSQDIRIRACGALTSISNG